MFPGFSSRLACQASTQSQWAGKCWHLPEAHLSQDRVFHGKPWKHRGFKKEEMTCHHCMVIPGLQRSSPSAELHSQMSCSYEVPAMASRLIALNTNSGDGWRTQSSPCNSSTAGTSRGTRTAAHPDYGSAGSPPWGRLWAACAGAKGNTIWDASNASTASPRQVLSVFKTVPAVEKEPHATQPQTKTNNKTSASETHLMHLVPICPLPLGQATTSLSLARDGGSR